MAKKKLKRDFIKWWVIGASVVILTIAVITNLPSSINNNVNIGDENINVISRNINLDDCLRVSETNPQNIASNQGENLRECGLFGSYRLFVVYYDFEPRSWINIQDGERIWTLEKEIVYEPQNQFGHFPNISGSAESVTDAKTGNIIGLIVPVEAQDEVDYKVIRHQYFVIRFSEQGPCFAGRSESRELARPLVTGSGICKALDEKTQ